MTYLLVRIQSPHCIDSPLTRAFLFVLCLAVFDLTRENRMGKKFSEDYQPSNYRSRNKLTLVLEAIKQENLLGTDEATSKENAEKAVFAWMAKAAFDPTPEQAVVANTCLNALIKKAWPDSKPSAEKVEFEYDRDKTPAENAQSVVEKVSEGDIAPDIGGIIIGMIKDTIAIHESTELVKRLEELESKLTKA